MQASRVASLAAVLSLALLGAGCAPDKAPVNNSPVNNAPVAPAPNGEVKGDVTLPSTTTPTLPAGTTTRTISFKAQGGSKVTGTATFTKVKEGLRVTIALVNSDVGSANSANIESGSCAERGETRYALSNVIKGASVTVLNDIGFEHLFNKEKTLSIKVKPTNSSNYVTCADLR